MNTPLSGLRNLSKSLLFMGLAFLRISSAESTLLAQSGGQDNWVWTGRKAVVPTAEAATARKCITINKNGMYVGLLKTPNTIEQYDLNGTFIKNWTATFTDLSGLASDTDGNVYAFDKDATKVSVFTSSGSLTASWGSAGSDDGQFSTSSGYMVHAIAVDEQKNVYVADWGNHRIQVFSKSGSFLKKFGGQGDTPGQFRDGPGAVAAVPNGLLIAWDPSPGWHHVVKFAAAGVYLNRSAPLTRLPAVLESALGQWSWFGYGGNSVFTTSTDGLLVVGAEHTYIPYGQAGRSTVFDLNTVAAQSNLAFPTNPGTRGAAFDLNGNFWAVRDTAVECLERRMRFDVYKPTKAIPQGSILNVSQVSDSKIVDIDYRVVDADSTSIETAIVGFVGGTRSWDKLVVPKTFVAMTPAAGTLAFTGTLTTGTLTTGSLASSITSDVPYRVSWNAAVDMPGQNFASLSFGVIARDGRPEIGVHYVTLPGDATNPGSLMVSSKPVQEDDLSDLWLWLLARRDPRVAVSGNTVTLTTAGQSYISGAPLPASGHSVANVAHDGSVTTVQGRAFAYKLINCRPITAAEKTRAQAGRFNLTSVDDNSVVSTGAPSPIGTFALVTGGTLPASSALGAVSVATFHIGKTEVTWGEWKTVRDWAVNNGYPDLLNCGEGSALDHPVRNVSWFDVVKWCNAKSEMERLNPAYYSVGKVYRSGAFYNFQAEKITWLDTANGYRLPRESEWEWAARGGRLSQGYTYAGSNDSNQVAWSWSNSQNASMSLLPEYGTQGTWPVGRKLPNELGIYDMSGNVWEWCWEAVDYNELGYARRIRGSSWSGGGEYATVFARITGGPHSTNDRYSTNGFRVVLNSAP
jgi:sulfatase modifying factor 1